MLMEENKPLAPLTTFGIGGPARWFVEASSEDDIAEAAAWATSRQVPIFVLGGGSNLLVSDAGFNGLVLRVGLRGIAVCPGPHAGDWERISTDEQGVGAIEDAERWRTAGGFPDKRPSAAKARVGSEAAMYGPKPVPFTEPSFFASCKALTYQAAAGEDWDGFVERAVEDNCAGIECLAGIPGTVGGTPVQNVGAYGQEVASTVERVRAFDLQERGFVELPAAACGFAYRRSRFNSTDRGRYIVTRVDYCLTPGGAPTVRYAELQRVLAERGSRGEEPGLSEVAAAVRRIRQAKGMLLVEGDPDCRSAGSFFKNPVVGEEQARQIAAACAKEPPRFPAGQDGIKLPAAWLIEQAGFAKGHTLGSAAVSSRHTLALVNKGGATAAEILALATQITAAVEARFGIHLEMEPVLLGF
jgi:UDP-N-acetylmuramate dehydrogenase